MQLIQETRGKYLLVEVNGRLDASWSDYFTDTMMNQIRQGNHHLIINASQMTFLSSAGIRSLLKIHRELQTVRGSLRIVESAYFVKKTLGMSGFQEWLAERMPDDMPDTVSPTKTDNTEIYQLNSDAELIMKFHSSWLPWKKVTHESVQVLSFPQNAFAIGTGSAAENFTSAREYFGEFMAVAGNVVFQPPSENSRPDYLISGSDFVPSMQCIQALVCSGEMSYLIRFAPSDQTHFFPVSELFDMILEQTGGEMAGFVIIGEIEGLVGASLTRSPGFISEDMEMSFPEIREWLSFSGERAFPNQQAILAGVVRKAAGKMKQVEPVEQIDQVNQTDQIDETNQAGQLLPLLPRVASRPDLAAHVHASVFPYQPLQNGKIDLYSSVRRFFTGPPPLAVMHLTDDIRPAVGIGQTALIRGACWCSPVKNYCLSVHEQALPVQDNDLSVKNINPYVKNQEVLP